MFVSTKFGVCINKKELKKKVLIMVAEFCGRRRWRHEAFKKDEEEKGIRPFFPLVLMRKSTRFTTVCLCCPLFPFIIKKSFF